MQKTTKRILTVLFLVFLVSCYYEISQAGLKKGRKINVKSPFSDLNNAFKTFKLDDFAVAFANLYWGVISPTFAGLFTALGEFIYVSTKDASDYFGYDAAYWFDFLMIP